MKIFERVEKALTEYVVSAGASGIYELASLFEDAYYLNKHDEPIVINEEVFYLVDHDFSGTKSEGEAWIVFHLEGETNLFRIKGSPSSWDGTSWELSSLEEVERVPTIVYTYTKV